MIKPIKSTKASVLHRVILPAVAMTSLLATAQFASAATDPQIVAARTAFQTADIEAVSGLANGFADQIGSGAIKLTPKNVKTLAKDAAVQILAKLAPPAPVTAAGKLSYDNAADEIVESAAFILDGIAGTAAAPNAKLSKLGSQKKFTLTILKAVVSAVKRDNGILTPSIAVFRDLAGSIALTLRSEPNFGALSNPAQFDKLVKFLGKKSKSIAGKTNQTQIQEGFNQGFASADSPASKYENGNNDANLVADPETDLHNA